MNMRPPHHAAKVGGARLTASWVSAQVHPPPIRGRGQRPLSEPQAPSTNTAIAPTTQGRRGDSRPGIHALWPLPRIRVRWQLAATPHPDPLEPALCSGSSGGLKRTVEPSVGSRALHSFQSTSLI